MMYLIGQLAIWLLLTAAFAALAGWAFAAERAASGEEASRRERENLLRDLIRFSGDGGDREYETDLDAAPNERLLAIRDGRIAELERALETARARGDELGGQLAEQQRRGHVNNPDAEELTRLRALEAERARTVDAEVEPVEDENVVLQAWRLRYFEQRVKYLEGQARDAAPAPAQSTPVPLDAETPPTQEWIAREAMARAAFLENELRELQFSAASATPSEDAEPFAADADVDALLRWRLFYLERRVAHLQSQHVAASAPAIPQQPIAAADPDRWRWRAHYLEARVRHLEQRPASVALSPEVTPAPVQPAAAPAPRPAAPSKRAKPPVLPSARNGAPDDLTLIEGVGLLQQTTLYSLGIFHFDQIAAWTDEHVAWVDQYLRLQGRIGDEEWVEQASDLARDGPAAARRAFEDEDA